MKRARSVCALVRHRLINCVHGRDCIVFMLPEIRVQVGRTTVQTSWNIRAGRLIGQVTLLLLLLNLNVMTTL